MKKLKKNNKGFSLVELIAAVAILAVVVVPLLNAFVTSSKVSKRTYEISGATLAAKNILESIDARPITEWQEMNDESLAAELLSYGDNNATITPIGTFDELGNLATSFIYKAVEKESEDGTKETVYQKTATNLAEDDSWTVGISNVVAGKNVYDAMVEISRGEEPNRSNVDDNGYIVNDATSTSDGLYLINDRELVQYDAMDANFAQDYIKSSNPDTMIEELYLNHSYRRIKNGEALEDDDKLIKNSREYYRDDTNYKIERKIAVFVYGDRNDIGEDVVWVTIVYHYVITHPWVNKDGDYYKVNSSVKYEEWTYDFNYPGVSGGVKPSSKDGSFSLHLEYFPFYDKQTGRYGPDEIDIYKISGETNVISENPRTVYPVDLKLFLHREKPQVFNSTTEEYDEIDFDDPRFFNYKVKVSSNLPEGYDIKDITGIYTTIPKECFEFSQTNIDYQFINLDDINDLDGLIYDIWEYSASEKDTFGPLRKEKSVRVYNVKVSVYPAGTFSKVQQNTKSEYHGSEVMLIDTSASNFGDAKATYVVEGTKTP